MSTGLDLSRQRSLYLLALDNEISLENRCPGGVYFYMVGDR